MQPIRQRQCCDAPPQLQTAAPDWSAGRSGHGCTPVRADPLCHRPATAAVGSGRQPRRQRRRAVLGGESAAPGWLRRLQPSTEQHEGGTDEPLSTVTAQFSGGSSAGDVGSAAAGTGSLSRDVRLPKNAYQGSPRPWASQPATQHGPCGQKRGPQANRASPSKSYRPCKQRQQPAGRRGRKPCPLGDRASPTGSVAPIWSSMQLQPATRRSS